MHEHAREVSGPSLDEDVVSDVLEVLDGVADLPLDQQAAVFESVHARLAERLTEQDA